MHIALACVTDARSMRAAVRLMKQADPSLSCIVIPFDLWKQLGGWDNKSLSWQHDKCVCEGIEIKVIV